MSQSSISIRLEQPADASAIDHVIALTFGPGMKARAAYALRENVEAEPDLSFVAIQDDMIVGSVRQTRIRVGGVASIMLGPIGVHPDLKHIGIGKQLMQQAVDAARKRSNKGGEATIILVGDLAYYAQFGFSRVPAGQISMPRPVDLSRILVCELQKGAASSMQGMAAKISA